jgi:hypothetical protein
VTNPGDSIIAAPDYAASEDESYAYGSTLGLTYGFNNRTSASVTGDFQYTDFLKESASRQDVRSINLTTNVSRNLTRNTALVSSYRYHTGDFGYTGGGTSIEQGVDFGMSYSKPLSATRRALVAFRIGAAAVTAPPLYTNTTVDDERYRLLSTEGSLAYEFKRTWQARAAWRRGFDYVMELTEPVSTEGVSAGIEGLFSNRIDFSASAGYSKGQSALSRGSPSFDTYAANVRLRRRLTGNIAAYAEYLYYFYDFRGNTQLAPGLPPQLERHGARVGLTLWVPALRR